MAAQNAVTWFEIPVTDLARATKFYESTLGVALAQREMGPTRMAMFPVHHGGPGSAGALVKEDGYTPAAVGSVIYLEVDDIEAALSRVQSSGGSTILPKTSVGPFGFVAQFKDSEGNRVAFHAER